MNDWYDILVPIFICCILPVSIVWITCWKAIYATRKRAEVLMKAIEYKPEMDVDSLARFMTKSSKTSKQILGQRLLCGAIFTLLGISTAIGCLILRFMYDDMILNIILILASCIFLPIGIGYLITWSVTRKYITEKEN